MEKLLFALFITGIITACGDKNKDYLVKIKTGFGDMTVLLYDETPLHKKNFLELAKSGRYDSTIFHRVIKNFMIQGGNINEKEGIQEHENDRIPTEIVAGFYHTKGALAAARQGDSVNPQKMSSSCQFYIVDGNSWEMMSTDINQLYSRMQQLMQDTVHRELLEAYQEVYAMRDNEAIVEFLLSKKSFVEEQMGVDMTIDPKTGDNEAYKKYGGSPHLDGAYTIFGRVVEGLNVIDEIASIKTQPGDIPADPILMTMEILEMKKKKITEKYGYKYPD